MTKNAILKRLIETSIEIEKSKMLYKENEVLIEALVKEVGLEQIRYKDHYIQIVDNFVEKNVKWKATAFRRFDIKISKI